jgi:hypothetical protein
MKKIFHICWFKYHHRAMANRYFQCRCGKRIVKSDYMGYTPIDFKWLTTK